MIVALGTGRGASKYDLPSIIVFSDGPLYKNWVVEVKTTVIEHDHLSRILSFLTIAWLQFTFLVTGGRLDDH